MKTKTNVRRAFYVLSATVVMASCQKSDLADSTASASSASTIAVAATPTGSGGSAAGADSVYLLQSCGRGGQREAIDQSVLPASAASYISANYSGATFAKAFVVRNSSFVITGYVAVIYYNDKPVGLEFDSAGNFVKVLEQREKGDLNGPGHHQGGRFEHRDGKQRDTVALSALPSSVTAYFAANYATDTLSKAFRSKDGSFVVLSTNSGIFATVFDANGAFVKREQVPARAGAHQSIELAQLPSVVAAYLSQTYPNYVFEKAFAISQSGSIAGYVVFLDANNTKYAVVFDASGNFLKAKTVR
jgi:hypothetical protein